MNTNTKDKMDNTELEVFQKGKEFVKVFQGGIKLLMALTKSEYKILFTCLSMLDFTGQVIYGKTNESPTLGIIEKLTRLDKNTVGNSMEALSKKGIIIKNKKGNTYQLLLNANIFTRAVTSADKEASKPFVKMFLDTIVELSKVNLTSSEYAVLLIGVINLNYETGGIYFKNKNFLVAKDFIRLTELGKTSVTGAIDSLVKKELFCKNKVGITYQLFCNPFVFCKGGKINPTLKKIFENTKWNISL